MTKPITIQVELNPAIHGALQALADDLGVGMSELVQAHLLKVASTAAMDKARKAFEQSVAAETKRAMDAQTLKVAEAATKRDRAKATKAKRAAKVAKAKPAPKVTIRQR